MQLTKHTDYALRTLLYLANIGDEEKVQIKQLADVFDISINHLTKIVNKLANEGYIQSFRGRNGGVCLGKEAHQINLGDVVRSMEATINPVECNDPPCVLRKACELKGVLAQAMGAFFQELDQYTLADVSTVDKKILKIKA